jgi:hypothetical protein
MMRETAAEQLVWYRAFMKAVMAARGRPVTIVARVNGIE